MFIKLSNLNFNRLIDKTALNRDCLVAQMVLIKIKTNLSKGRVSSFEGMKPNKVTDFVIIW